MRTVAMAGGASETRAGVANSQADEIWTVNWSYKYDFIPRIDRLFEMHPVWMYAGTDKPEYIKMRDHWDWLQQPQPYPIYMMHHLERVPSCVRYPIEDITKFIFGHRLLRDEEPADFYSSSFDYMMAMAIYEGWDVIELYGFEMGSETEYRYQREGAAFFIGQAVARGITVKRPGNSVILRAKRYGYEGGQMIFRQDLERMLAQFQKRKRDAMARVQYYEGAVSNGRTEELLTKLSEAREDALIASGGEQLLIYQIREIDLEEPELQLVNPFERVKL